MPFLNADWISTASDVLIVLIWSFYLQLFYRDAKRGNRPCMIIHHAHGHDAEGLCLFVNMSKDPIHVQCVVAYVSGPDEYAARYVTDYRRLTHDERDIGSRLREGPIQPGGYLVLGSFKHIILGAQSEDGEHDDWEGLQRFEQLQLCIAVTHGPSERHIGVRRTFAIEHNQGRVSIRAHSIYTEQLVTRSKRKTVRRWVEESLNPEHRGAEQSPQKEQGGGVDEQPDNQ